MSIFHCCLHSTPMLAQETGERPFKEKVCGVYYNRGNFIRQLEHLKFEICEKKKNLKFETCEKKIRFIISGYWNDLHATQMRCFCKLKIKHTLKTVKKLVCITKKCVIIYIKMACTCTLKMHPDCIFGFYYLLWAVVLQLFKTSMSWLHFISIGWASNSADSAMTGLIWYLNITYPSCTQTGIVPTWTFRCYL